MPAVAAGSLSGAEGDPPPDDTMVLVADHDQRSLTRKRSKDEPAWLGGALFEQFLNAQALGRDAERAASRQAGDANAMAQDVLEDFMAAMRPRNRIERLLAMQMLWQHARIGRLSMMEATPNNTRLDIAKSLNLAVDKAMSTFTRQVLAWSALRDADDSESSDSSNELG